MYLGFIWIAETLIKYLKNLDKKLNIYLSDLLFLQ